MTSNDTSWFPVRGRYHVEVAASVTRALKARKEKGENPPPAAKRSKIPVRDFHSLRYNFHPPSLDRDGVGSITVRTGKDITSVAVERSSSQPGDGSLFTGFEHPAKDWECVLIFDEVNKKFFLEKLDSHMALTFERKVTMPVERPPPRAAPAESSSKRSHNLIHEAEELEKQYLGADEDAVGEVDDELEEILPQSIAQRQEEEEEEEEINIPPPAPLPSKAKPKLARPTKPSVPPPVPTPSPSIPAPKARQPPKPTVPAPPKQKPAPPPQRGRGRKREPDPASSQQLLSDADEELEFGKPARKRARRSPPSEGLALPGSSTSVYNPPPPVPVPVPVPRPSSNQRPPPPPPPTAPLLESEEEEEWDEVAAVDKANNDDDAEDNFDIFGDAAAASANGVPQDTEMDAFERELNLQMEESDEDFLADAVETAEEEPTRGMPISLTQLAAGANGGAGYGSEDEYSSSDDSDDE